MFLSKRKNGFYYLFYEDETTGKRKMVSCKTKKKPEALKFLTNFKVSKKGSKRINSVHYLKDLKEEIMHYANDNFTSGTVKIYRVVFTHLLRILNDKPIRLITNKEIENYKSIRLKEVTPSTVNIDLSTIKAIFNIAIKWNWLEENPVNKVNLISIPQKEILSFSDSEIKLILNNIEDLTFKNFVLVGLYTGCRLDEICNIQIKDINLKDQILNIRNKPNFKTKTGKIRNIPISDELYSILQSMLGNDNNIINLFDPERYLFQNKENVKFHKDYISKSFKKILRKLNLPEKYHFHCLRHTFITQLIKKGVNINYVKEIAGHSDIQTTMNYIHIVTNDLREAVNKISLT